MARQPKKGTFDYTIRDVAEREGWSERKTAAILKDGILGGHDAYARQRMLERRGIEEMKDTGEIRTGRKGERS